MLVCSLLLFALVGVALGAGSEYPTADDPCGVESDVFRWKINTTAQTQLMSECTTINHTLWIENNYPGVFSLPKLINVDGIYIGDAFYSDTTQAIASGTLTGVSLPAVTSTFEILAINIGSIESIDIPNLAAVGLTVELSGLPALKTFTFSENFNGQYVNITNTGLTQFAWKSSAYVYDMRLIGNVNLQTMTFADKANISQLTIDCGGLVGDTGAKYYLPVAPMPRLSGPASVRNLEIRYCKQPEGDSNTALNGVGSTSSNGLTFHHNDFVHLALPGLVNSESIKINNNRNLTEVSFPSLESVHSIDVLGNSKLKYIDASTFPALNTIKMTANFDGSFASVAIPPKLVDGHITVESTNSSLNCSSFTPYTKYYQPDTGPHITASCAHPLVGDGSSNGGSLGDSHGHTLQPRLIVAIVVPVVGLVFWIIVIWILCVRRRNRRRAHEVKIAALQLRIHNLAEPIQLLEGAEVYRRPWQPPISPVSPINNALHKGSSAVVVTTSPVP